MSVEASGQDIINWLKQWKQAKTLGSQGPDIPEGFWITFDDSIEYFENGGEYHSPFVLYKGNVQ